MTGHLSSMPPCVTLDILLLLPNLQALYAAILASPHLWRIFYRYQNIIFWTIVKRSMPDSLIEPIVHYINQNELIGLPVEIAGMTATGLARNYHVKGLLHVIAQAIRIHDLAYFILRTKLDYMSTLKYYKLKNPKARYPSVELGHPNNLATIPMPTPKDLQDPSWVEESRAVRTLWRLSTEWRAGRSQDLDMDTALEADTWDHTVLPVYEMQEIKQSLLEWPTLQPPRMSDAPDVHAHHRSDSQAFSVLECYTIPCPPYCFTSARQTEPGPPTSPLFSRIPPAIPEATSETNAWGRSEQYLDCTRLWWHLRNLDIRPDSPWYRNELALRIFRRLGFDIWDYHRSSSELNIEALPPLFLPVPPGRLNGARNVKVPDEMCRFFHLLKQEGEREGDGWKRRQRVVPR